MEVKVDKGVKVNDVIKLFPSRPVSIYYDDMCLGSFDDPKDIKPYILEYEVRLYNDRDYVGDPNEPYWIEVR